MVIVSSVFFIIIFINNDVLYSCIFRLDRTLHEKGFLLKI